MRKLLIPLTVLLLSSCSGEEGADRSENESNKDELNDVSEDSVSKPQTELIPGESDTLVPFKKKLPPESNFSSDQLQPNQYFLFYKDAVPIYKTGDLLEVVDSLYLAESVIFLKEYGDFNIVEGFPGSVAEVKKDTLTRFMRTNFLLPYPNPVKDGKTEYVSQYPFNYFHQADSVIYEGEFYGEVQKGREMEWFSKIYEFENGIRYLETEGYENGSSILELSNTSVTSGLLLMDAIEPRFDFLQLMGGYPTKEKYNLKTPEGWQVYISCKFSQDEFQTLEEVNIESGEGCFEWFKVDRKDNRVRIDIGAGC